MQNTKWSLIEKKTNLSSLKIDNDVLSILASRGITKKEDILNFINPKIENLSSPKLLFDLEKASNRIITAIKNNEKICIYGDYDVDGITSTSILYLGLKELGAKNIDFYIPIRDEGYGLNTQALEQIKNNNVDLVITVDCGITSYKEIDFANSINLSVIITDHHNLLNPIVPNAYAVVNPKRLENKFPFKELAGVGTAFMVLIDVFDKYGKKDDVYKYIDLVALGTIADVVPLIKDNRIIVKQGLKQLKNTKNLGLKLLLNRIFPNKTDEFRSTEVSFNISPIFNAAGRMQDAKLVVHLLISNNELEINAIIDELIRKNIERKEIQNNIFELAKKELENSKDYVLISSSPNYHHGVIGIVAAKIVDTYYKPSIILEEKTEEGIAVASCRSINNFDITKALQHCGELLEKFGGHIGAAGFTIKIENIPKFKSKINDYAKENIKEEDFCKKIYIDKSINIQKISYEFYKTLELLQPFGMANPEPLFITKNVIVENAKIIGEKKNHLSFDVSQKGFLNKGAVWFFKHNFLEEIKSGIFYDIVFKLNTNQYKGKYYTKILIEDMKESLLKDDKYSFLKSIFETKFPLKSIIYTEKEINLAEKVDIVFNYDRVNIYQNNTLISKLDNNLARLLIQLKQLYNMNFKIKFNEIKKINDLYNIDIIIQKDFDFITYKKEEKNLFNQIKKELIQELDYDSTTKLALSNLFKNKKNILLSKKNITLGISNNILKTFAIFNKKKNNEDTLLLSKDKNILLDEKLIFFTTKKYTQNCKNLILDKNTYTDNVDLSKFDKIILLDDSIENKDNFVSIINKIELPENVLKLNKSNIKKYGTNNIYTEFLPNKEKNEIKEKLKNKENILADDSIFEIL